jgi:hypothetical protein
MKFKSLSVTVFIALISWVLWPLPQSALAQNPPLSPGCQEINSNPLYQGGTTAGANIAGPFNTGEQIRITLTNPIVANDTANLATNINGTLSLATSTTIPGVLEYTIPVGYVDAVLLIMGGFADASWTCGYLPIGPGGLGADLDSDGLPGGSDNCPTVANPDQANGWGSPLGDACDSDLYDNGRGVKTFQIWRNGVKSPLFEVYANCTGRTCERIALLDFSSLPPRVSTSQGEVGSQDQAACAALLAFADLQNPTLLAAQQECQRANGGGGGWYVEVFDQGNGIWQVNVYDPAGVLQDDLLEVALGEGAVRWQVRR